MFYFERSYQVLNQVHRLSAKVIYDTVRPFIEMPPDERNLESNKIKAGNEAANLFNIFTADIIKSNVLFTR